MIETVPTTLDFSALHAAMRGYVDSGVLPHCATAVLVGGDVVDVHTCGHMDRDSGRPLGIDAIFRMYSSTKLITSVAAMTLFEERRFGLDDSLQDYLPAFARCRVLRPGAASLDDATPAASPITLRHVLSHTAGFTYGFLEPESVLGRAYLQHGINSPDDTLEAFVDKLAALPLAFEPGTGWRYSVATDVVARLIEVLSGQRFDAFLNERIFDPLGMVDTGFHVPADKHHRFTTMYAPADPLQDLQPATLVADAPDDGQYSRPRARLSGGGGLCSTLPDYLAFIRMLIGDGGSGGMRILHPETLDLMRSNQLAAGVSVTFPTWSMPDTVFGLGFALRAAPAEGDPETTTGEYFWGGLAGTHSWVAPRARLAGICMTQRMPGFWHPYSHDFRRLVHEAASA